MKNIWAIAVFAVLFRIFLSFSTYHPDIQALSDGGKFIAQGHLLNFYDYSSENLVLNYPPLVYWFFGLLNLFFNGNIPLLKLFYLLFDISAGILLYKVTDPKKAILVFSLWLFNPVSLYVSYMMGQFDIIPTFFTVLSLYFAIKHKLSWAALALGGGIAFKLYPIFLVIPLIVLAGSFRMKIKLAFYSILPYLVSILPYLSSRSFKANALFASQSSKSLYAAIPISGGESILLFPCFLILFYLLIWQKKVSLVEVWRVYSIPLFIFYIFTHYHPQWLLWITPFLILDLVLNRFGNLVPILLIFITWVGSLFFFDSSLTLGIFAPLLSDLKNSADIWTILHKNIDFNFSRSVLQTIFSASSIFLIYRYFPKYRQENG